MATITDIETYFCWAPPTPDGTPRTEWYVVQVVAGPMDLDAAIKDAARRNRELEERRDD